LAQHAGQSPRHLRSSWAMIPFFSITHPQPDATREGPGRAPSRPAPKPDPTAPFKPFRTDPLNREPPVPPNPTYVAPIRAATEPQHDMPHAPRCIRPPQPVHPENRPQRTPIPGPSSTPIRVSKPAIQPRMNTDQRNCRLDRQCHQAAPAPQTSSLLIRVLSAFIRG
jgi:hypothetical protein